MRCSLDYRGSKVEVISTVVTLESRLWVLWVVTFALLLASVGMLESIDSQVDEYVSNNSGGSQPFRCGSKMFNTACKNDDTILDLQYCLLISSISPSHIGSEEIRAMEIHVYHLHWRPIILVKYGAFQSELRHVLINLSGVGISKSWIDNSLYPTRSQPWPCLRNRGSQLNWIKLTIWC